MADIELNFVRIPASEFTMGSNRHTTMEPMTMKCPRRDYW